MDKTENAAKKKKRLFLRITCAAAVLLFLFYAFGGHDVTYGEIRGGVRAVVRDGITEFDYEGLTAKGQINWTGGLSAPLFHDGESGLTYHFWTTTVSVQRWYQWFRPGTRTDDVGLRLNADCRPCGYGEGSTVRILEVFYREPSGAYYSVWRHPDYETILKKAGLTAYAPEDYYLTRRR